MKRLRPLLVACSIIVACGNFAGPTLSEARTAEAQLISSPRYIEEFQEKDNEVQSLDGLHQALKYHSALTANYLEFEHGRQVAEWRKSQQKRFQAVSVGDAAANASPAPSGDFYYRLAKCEGGGQAKNWPPEFDGDFTGFFQFMDGTWRATVGSGPGDQAWHHSYEEQRNAAAKNITPMNFHQQHPHCHDVMMAEGWTVPND